MGWIARIVAAAGMIAVALCAWWWTQAGAPDAATRSTASHEIHHAEPAARASSPDPHALREAAIAAGDPDPSPGEAASAPDATPLPGAVEIAFTWLEDGGPAPGICVRAVPSEHDGSAGVPREAHSSDTGTARLEPLPSGKVWLEIDRCAAMTVAVTEGAVTRRSIQIPRGATVEAIVLDARGQPFPGADVYLAGEARRDGFIVARSGADGTFRVHGILGKRFLGARAAGFAPSILPEIVCHPGQVVKIELMIDHRAGSIDGLLLDGAGAPVAHAAVRLEPGRGWTHRADGTFGLTGVAVTTHTDERGAFLLVVLNAQGEPVHHGRIGRIRGFPWSDDLTLPPGTYHVRASTPDGRTGEASLTVTDQPVSIEIALR